MGRKKRCTSGEAGWQRTRRCCCGGTPNRDVAPMQRRNEGHRRGGSHNTLHVLQQQGPCQFDFYIEIQIYQSGKYCRERGKWSDTLFCR
ncbi:hypothetical protein F2P81_004793 [Scophthalmus maximus]|uniref:Uncharacterized protein n=1 Tax=Scophthalmus maximus TaxID=52904 RepID=A0A6A4T7D9_SCOMX|nr:hypothetical protein F2P81_004793 [Scophthalmus maximus]